MTREPWRLQMELDAAIGINKRLSAEVERLRTDYHILKNDYDAQRAEIARLQAVLDAARICFKNRDQSEREAAVYAAICAALDPKL